MPHSLIDISTSVQAMARCHHYLNQYWPRPISAYGDTRPPWDNPLCPNNFIWQRRSGLTLTLKMAHCLTIPGHCSNQCWLITKCVLWHSPWNNLRKYPRDNNLWSRFENYRFRYTAASGAKETTATMNLCHRLHAGLHTFNIMNPSGLSKEKILILYNWITHNRFDSSKFPVMKFIDSLQRQRCSKLHYSGCSQNILACHFDIFGMIGVTVYHIYTTNHKVCMFTVFVYRCN